MSRFAALLALLAGVAAPRVLAEDADDLAERFISRSIESRESELEYLESEVQSLRSRLALEDMTGRQRKAVKAAIEEKLYFVKHPQEFFPTPRLNLRDPMVGDLGRITVTVAGPVVVKGGVNGAYIQWQSGNERGPVMFVRDLRFAKLQAGDPVPADEAAFAVTEWAGGSTSFELRPIDMKPIQEEIAKLQAKERSTAKKNVRKSKPAK